MYVDEWEQNTTIPLLKYAVMDLPDWENFDRVVVVVGRVGGGGKQFLIVLIAVGHRWQVGNSNTVQ